MMAMGRRHPFEVRRKCAGHRVPRSAARAGPCGVTALALVLACLLSAGRAGAQAARQDFYITNGTVNAQVLAGNSLYIGGSFTNVGPVIGCGVPLDPATGSPVPGFPQVNGHVNAVLADGSGGWFVGGAFSQVGGASRANLAHVRSDLSVDDWNPGANDQVLALAIEGGTVYAGGAFTSVGGNDRSRLVAIDAATGGVLGWNPGANDLVRALAASGNTVYAGGRFSIIGEAPRNYVAALDARTGLALPWNPGASLEVYALAARSGLVYAGGQFTMIGGQSRNRIAAVDSATGVPAMWNPNANGQVSAIAFGATSVYVGGSFTTIGSTSRLRVAEISTATGAATAWDPSANGSVSALAVSGATVYVGGDFLSIGGQLRSRLAAIDVGTALATAWNPVAYATVQAIAVSGGVVYAGGTFGGVGGQVRNNLAALDLITGAPTSWNPNVNGAVLALALNGNTLYAGGSFTQVGGMARNGLAALDLPSGTPLAWNAATDGQVTAITVDNGVVYVGGSFTTAGGQPRSNIAALDTTTALATAWAPGCNGQVFRMLATGGLVYVGGSFSTIGGSGRDNIAALDPVTGAASAWNPNANGTIRDLAVTCGSVYAGGFFTNIGGAARNRLAALDPSTGVPTAWNPDANGPVFCLSLNDGVLYAGGVLDVIGGLSRNRLAALDPVTGLATPWSPNADNTVRSIVVGGGALYAGGSFTSMGGTPQCNVAALPVDASITCPVIAVSPAQLPDGIVGTAYDVTLAASGGTAPYCWTVVDGTLPPGLSLSPGTGELSGTPSAPAASAFEVRVTDAHGCTGDRTYTLDVFAGPVGSTVTAVTTGLCVNPAHSCVAVPFVYQRTDSVPARGVSVTFQIDTARLALCTPSSPYSSIQMGSWLDAFSNQLLQVVDNGGGSYTVDVLLLGQPCGQPRGGTLFTARLASAGPDGLGAVSVTSVHVRDCDNSPIAVLAGAPESLLVENAPVVISPSTLSPATEGTAYHVALAAAPGTAPFTFSISAGALPPGITLSSAGVLDGTSFTPGPYAFTARATDVYGSTGIQAYSLPVSCPAISLGPGALPDMVVGAGYTQSLATSAGRAPIAYSITSGAPPAGLSLSGAGLLSGTPSATGTSTFTVQASDTGGCAATRSYTLSAFGSPITSTITPVTTGLCLGTGHPTTTVPFVLARTDTTPTRAVSVTFRLDTTRVVLRTPAAPESSVAIGPWFAGTSAVSQVTGWGDGSYTVDIVILGDPCGPTTGGTLFTLGVAAAASSGTGAITVTATHVRDCSNQAIPVGPGAPGSILLGTTAPGAIADLVATPVASGNGAGPTTGIQLAWTSTSGDTVRVYRAPYASYPTYAGGAPDSTAAPGAPWTLAATVTSPGVVDRPPVRGFWYYVALITDPCGGTSVVSNRTRGTLDYLLGDVSDGATPGTGNDAVGIEDITLLGANYGIDASQIAARNVAYLDVGPTTDLALTSRPAPDGKLDFEDLMVFSGNFDASATAPPASPAAARRPARAGAAATASSTEAVHGDAPASVLAGGTLDASLTLAAAGRIHGFSVALTWDPTVVAPAGVRSSGFVEGQGGLVLSPAPGGVDGALLGRAATGLEGTGEIARFTFTALRSGEPAIAIARVLARDGNNQPLPPDALADAGPPAPPAVTELLPPTPNPFQGSAVLAFSLARAGPVRLAIYSVDGRRVRVLADGYREAGRYRLAWDGRDEGRGAVAPGVYFARFAAGGRQFTARLVHLR